jgi:hypothetical protein
MPIRLYHISSPYNYVGLIVSTSTRHPDISIHNEPAHIPVFADALGLAVS